MIEQLASLDDDAVAQVSGLVTAATTADGVSPLSEHVLLHLRHGGDAGDGREGDADGDRHLLARDHDRIVGYAHLDPTDPVAGAVAEVVVDPARRGHGIGRQLVEAALAATTDGRLRLWAHGSHPAAAALAAALGFEEGRRLEQWRRSLYSPLPPVELPDGVRLRSFVPGTDDAAWLALNARAFADHPEQGSWTATELTARLAEAWFDPDGFLLAEAEARAAGRPQLIAFHWTKVHGGSTHHPLGAAAHAHEPIGEVYVVGVDPAWQGHGLGRAVTLAGLHRLRSLGLGQAMLYVESDNLAAQAVYRRLGFTPWDADRMFHRRRPA